MPVVPRDATSVVDVRAPVTRSASGGVASTNRRDATNTSNNHDGEENDTRMTVDDVTTEKTIKLAINAAYTDWSARDAFRELVRHWHNSILTRHGLSESELLVQSFESPEKDGALFEAVFVATATVAKGAGNGNGKECLGYIRYKSTTKDDSGQFIDGTVDIVSRRNLVQPWHFDLGASPLSPSNADVFCGRLPLAFVALMRNEHNHNIACTSGGLLWTGNHSSKGRPVVHLRRLTDANKPCTRSEHRMMTSQVLPQAEEGQQALFLFGPDIETDLHVQIGDTRKVHCADRYCARSPAPSYDEAGQPVTRCGVSLAQFGQWTKTALCLWIDTTPSSKIVQTPAGDLLLVPALQGLRYEDGFLVPETTSTRLSNPTSSNKLHYGYNFKTKDKNVFKDKKDCSFLLHPHSMDNVREQIKAIWEAVLQQRPDLTQELHGLLMKGSLWIGAQYHYPTGVVAHGPDSLFSSPADVWAIKHSAGKTLARLLWQHLRQQSMAVGAAANVRPRGGLWYYSRSEAIANQRLLALVSAQGRRGVMLDDNYWHILETHCNICTFSEMEQQELAWAPVVAIGTRGHARLPQMLPLSKPHDGTPSGTDGARPAAVSSFQTSLIRLLHATFLGTDLTRRYGFVFVKPAANIDLDIAFVDVRGLFYIHARWLDLDYAASKLGLAPAANANVNAATDAHASSCAYDDARKQCRAILHGADADRERVVLLHATKTLFAWALDRLPLPHHYASQTDFDRHLMYRQVVIWAEKRIQDNLDLQGTGRQLFVFSSREQTRASLHWTAAVHQGRAVDMIVQCHQASCTVRSYSADILRSSVAQLIGSESTVLLARDLNPDNMPCLRATVTKSKTKTAAGKPFCCTSKRVTTSFDRVVLESPTPGNSYILVAVQNPDDQYAIASSVDSFTFPRPPATDQGTTTSTSAPAPTAPIPVVGASVSTGTQPSTQRSTDMAMADAGSDDRAEAGSRKRRRTGDGDGDASAGANKPSSDPESIALCDYQLQLIILEHQNKKRLLMARQEQDMAAEAAGAELAPR